MPRPKTLTDSPAPDAAAARRRRLKRLRAALEGERAFLARWMTRRKRAFHSVEKSSARVARIEREIRKVEEA